MDRQDDACPLEDDDVACEATCLGCHRCDRYSPWWVDWIVTAAGLAVLAGMYVVVMWLVTWRR